MDTEDRMKSLRESWRELRRPMPDIRQESFTVEGLSHLLCIPRDVIAHEIAAGDLKAVRCGHRTVCIDRAAVLEWLRLRGPGV